jgi:hypothetical protein
MRMSDEDFGNIVGVSLVLLYVVLVLLGLVGYAMNVGDFVREINEPISALFVARAVGFFVFPLGAILGWVA